MPGSISMHSSIFTKRRVMRLTNPSVPWNRTVNLAWFRYPKGDGAGSTGETSTCRRLSYSAIALRTTSRLSASWCP